MVSEMLLPLDKECALRTSDLDRSSEARSSAVEQYFSTMLMLWTFNMIPHGVTLNH